jgi:hypothetical protein
MAPGHAKLGPSSASRWLTCPGSVSLSAHVVDVGGAAASEGTACHRMMEAFLKEGTPIRSWVGKQITVAETEDGPAHVGKVLVRPEMAGWVEEAAGWITDYLNNHDAAHLMSEERVHVGRYFGCPDEIWGTADVVIDGGLELVIADLKAGYNDVPVKDNDQLILYAIGAMNEYGWVHPAVRLVILQPRCGEPKEKVYSQAEIIDKAKSYAPKIRAALQPGGPLVPSDEACKWCPAAGLCPALQAENLALAKHEFSDDSIRLLDREKLLTLLQHADQIRSALAAAERHALSLAQSGVKLPGWKVVCGEKRRTWAPGKEGAAQVVLETEHGLDLNEVAPRKLATPPQVAEKLAPKLPGKTKKEKLEAARALVFAWTEIPKGEPTLAPDNDDRPALKPGAEFEEVAP